MKFRQISTDWRLFGKKYFLYKMMQKSHLHSSRWQHLFHSKSLMIGHRKYRFFFYFWNIFKTYCGVCFNISSFPAMFLLYIQNNPIFNSNYSAIGSVLDDISHFETIQFSYYGLLLCTYQTYEHILSSDETHESRLFLERN